jgi:hypothetical protein
MYARLILRVTIYLLLLLTFCLGLPSFHYSVALMIAALLKFKDHPKGLLSPIF